MLSGDIWAKTKGSQEHSGVRGVLSRMARGDSAYLKRNKETSEWDHCE